MKDIQGSAITHNALLMVKDDLEESAPLLTKFSASNLSACHQQYLFPARHWQQSCDKDQFWGPVGFKEKIPHPAVQDDGWAAQDRDLRMKRC